MVPMLAAALRLAALSCLLASVVAQDPPQPQPQSDESAPPPPPAQEAEGARDAAPSGASQRGVSLPRAKFDTDQDMVRDLALEGVNADNAKDNLLICSGTGFDDMLRICQLLEEFAPDLVIYDCLTSMACADVRIGDPSYADPIRLLVRHNGLAWPKCAHVILHHTTRDEPTRFSGTEQIKAATEELWTYYPPELLKWKKGTPRPTIGYTRHLVMEKSRSGYAGRSLSLTRNPFEGHWQFRRSTTEASSPIDQLTEAFRAVKHDEWKIASEWRTELVLSFNGRTLRRYLEQLDGTALESERQRSRITGRMDTHYRPTRVMRDAARAMVSAPGDGINEV
jgi:hypothetical protein